LVVDFLLQRGLKPIVVLLDASTFGGDEVTSNIIESVRLLRVPLRVVKNGMDLSAALSSTDTP